MSIQSVHNTIGMHRRTWREDLSAAAALRSLRSLRSLGSLSPAGRLSLLLIVSLRLRVCASLPLPRLYTRQMVSISLLFFLYVSHILSCVVFFTIQSSIWLFCKNNSWMEPFSYTLQLSKPSHFLSLRFHHGQVEHCYNPKSPSLLDCPRLFVRLMDTYWESFISSATELTLHMRSGDTVRGSTWALQEGLWQTPKGNKKKKPKRAVSIFHIYPLIVWLERSFKSHSWFYCITIWFHLTFRKWVHKIR